MFSVCLWGTRYVDHTDDDDEMLGPLMLFDLIISFSKICITVVNKQVKCLMSKSHISRSIRGSPQFGLPVTAPSASTQYCSSEIDNLELP
jgi:hypothetical protein